MSSRFDNLIKLVVDRFEINDYNLLSEALSLTQIQDQLKQKNIDLSQYNPKHYLFLLALLNSNLNLDIYNQITTSIKDQGILNRLMSQTVDKRSNEPTVNVDIINRVLHNTSNIPELNAILNSIGQSRENEKPVATEEDKAKGIEDLATRTKKEVTKALVDKFGAEMSNSILSTSIFHLIDLAKEKYPNDRLVSNYSYALPLASYWLNLPDGADDNQINKLGSLLNDLFPRYMADNDIRQKKVIFNEPYRSNFYKFSNYLYQYFREKRFKEEGKDGDLMNASVFKNEDVTVYAGTVEDTHGSIRRCIKYGKGVNPKYGFCISGSSAGSHYTNYRFDTSNRKHLTTYFVYFNKPEDIQKYNSELFIFEPFYNSNDKLTYQYNPGRGNPGETRITPEDAIIKYPMLKEPLEKGVFKVVNVDEKEKTKYAKIQNASIEKLESVDDLIDWIEATDPTLTNHEFERIEKKFPEGLEYALDFYIKRTIDFAEDNIEMSYIFNRDNGLEYYVFNDIEEFLKKHPELKEKYDKLKPNLKLKEIRLVVNNGQEIPSRYFEKLAKEYPTLTQKAIDDYVIARENSWNEQKYHENLYKHIFNSLEPFFSNYPEYGIKYKGTIDEFQIKEMELIISTGQSVTSDYFHKFAKLHPALIDDAIDRYIKKRLDIYLSGSSQNSYIRDAVFGNTQGFINSNPVYKEKYAVTPELKEYEMQTLIKTNNAVSAGYLEEIKRDYPDALVNFLDAYIKNRAELILSKPLIDRDYDSNVKNLYVGNVKTFIKDNPEFKDRYKDYDNKLIIHYFTSNPRSHLIVSTLDFQRIQQKYPDVLEKCMEIYLTNKIQLLQDIRYSSQTESYFTSYDDEYSYNDVHYMYIEPEFVSYLLPFIEKLDEQMKNKFIPLLNKIDEVTTINSIILTNKILNSEDIEKLQKTLPEDKLEDVLDKYFKNKIDDYNHSIKLEYNTSSATIPPKGDLEYQVFYPLRKFFHYNPKIAEKYKETQKELKLKAFDVCGEPEGTYGASDYRYNQDPNDMYLTTEWLQDIKNRFPDILQKGLDIYIPKKLKNPPNRNIKQHYSDYDEFQLVNVESEVFKRIHEFEEQNKSLFGKYTELRMSAIIKFINKMDFDQLLDSQFFFRLEQTFRPTFYRVIFKEYIDKKLKHIEEVKKRGDEEDNYGDRVNPFEHIANDDLHGYIFDQLEEFIETHPELNDGVQGKTKELQYDFLVKYLTKPKGAPDDELYRKAKKYLRYLNNNEEDNTEIYQRIINQLIELNTNSISATAAKTIYAFKSFYENIDDKETLKKIFSIEANKEYILKLIAYHDIGTLFATDQSMVPKYFHDLIKFKIKTSKLKEANPKSFYRMLNDIFPNTGDTILEHLFKTTENTGRPIYFNQILDVFFKDNVVYNYINENKKYKNNLFNLIQLANITNISVKPSSRMSTDNAIKQYLEFIDQFPKYKETDKVYKLTHEYDQEEIKKYKTIEEKNNGLLDTSYVTINYFHTPPDLRNIVVKSSYSREITIKVQSPYPIKTLKFLPYATERTPAVLELSDCVLENNIDYITKGVTKIELDGVTVALGKAIIAKHILRDDIKNITLRSVKNLKSLEGLNITHKLPLLKIHGCKELISLKGSPNEVVNFDISACENLKNLKGAPLQADDVTVKNMYGLLNFVGIPRSKNYELSYNVINSFKGLPNRIHNLKIADALSNKHLTRKSYSYFPDIIENLFIPTNIENKTSKSSFWKYLFSRIKNVFPSYIGNIDTFIGEQLLDDDNADPFVEEIRKIYNKKQLETLSKKDREKETTERIKQERTPTKQDELEDIESKQDKVANKQKIKRLRKEDVEVAAPFNVLLEDILNTIKTSFKVYK